MIQQLRVLALIAGVAIGGAPNTRAQSPPQLSTHDHIPWVAQTLKRMEGIKPGMTRADLLKVFTTEGGLSTGLQPTFVSRDCPFFKVDVEFEAVGRPAKDRDGRVTLVEDSRDIIIKISRPYLQPSVVD